MGLHDTLLRLSAIELAQLYRQRDLSPVEVIRAVLARSARPISMPLPSSTKQEPWPPRGPPSSASKKASHWAIWTASRSP
jgi:hypothetical protein